MYIIIFLLYIDGVVTRLHDGKCGVQCRGDMVPSLLFAKSPLTKKGWRRAWMFWLSGVKSGGGG